MNKDFTALSMAADFLKVTTSLSTGALVFGTGLIGLGSIVPNGGMRTWAIWGAALLLISTSLGLLSMSRLPMLVDEEKTSPNDLALTIPGAAHEVTLVAGILSLAVASLGSAFANPPGESIRIPDAATAVRMAQSHLGSGVYAAKVEMVELIRGTDGAALKDLTWHVRLAIVNKKRSGGTSMRDYFENAVSGEISSLSH
jgi:hypothetical protein